MRWTLFTLLIAVSLTPLSAQMITLGGGTSPNGLRGSHLSLKVEAYQSGRWILAANYRMVRYTDAFRLWIRPSPLLHKEYRQDEVIIDFAELGRGYLVQSGDGDFRPRDLFHAYAAMAGYELWDTYYFRMVAYAGIHYSSNRTYTYNISASAGGATVTLEEGDEPIVIDYNDYTIYRA